MDETFFTDARLLHVYGVANQALRTVVARYQDELRSTGVAEAAALGLQPLPYPHITVQAFSVYRHQIDDAQLTELLEAGETA